MSSTRKLAKMTSALSAPDITSRLVTTGGLLVRSGIEIGRLLDSMLEDQDPLTATLPQSVLFLSRLVYVEPVRGFMLLSFADHKAANSAALASRSLTLRCNHRGAQFAFAGEGPRQTSHSGHACIQCSVPRQVVGMQHRAQVRGHLPENAPVGCDVRLGLQSFAARVADVSQDGICMLMSDPTIPLCAGTRLQRARIRHPRVEPFEVDFEVRNVSRVALPNGERASRIGCKVVGSRETLEQLIRLFIIDLA
ncbi:MAG TPA: flagellar regulator YcgR PilZN domain-containing protein [Burkholderiales bacterium]|nr:flagellar regulator YcgR PilZN domain-containing protein [Burkholderiales bacterium]